MVSFTSMVKIDLIMEVAMRLDYKSIIIKHYVLHLSSRDIADQIGASKSGVGGFLQAFEKAEGISYPLPPGITNEGIHELVYPHSGTAQERDESYMLPDFPTIHQEMTLRKNMTLVFLWNRYSRNSRAEGKKPYSYRQFCSRFADWCDENNAYLTMVAYSGQSMEVDFAGNTFRMADRLTGEISIITVFVAILPYSGRIYAEGMISTKEPHWIQVNNHALDYFGGIPAIVVPDNCKQAVITNRDWIDPELNTDYSEWADHNGTAILPAKVRRPRFKSHVENAVKILEQGLFHVLEERQYFSLGQFNRDLRDGIDRLNDQPFKGKEHSRNYYWEQEKHDLMPLPPAHYEYAERKKAKVSSDFHVCFDNAYYSADKAFLHKDVLIRATADRVRIYSMQGDFICEHPRAAYKGQHLTDVSHLPGNLSSIRAWSGPYFIGKAMETGTHTVEVIRAVLASRKLEVQTYRMCAGILGYKDRYSRKALEECCTRAMELNRPNYSYIKNTIAAVAEELGVSPAQTRKRGNLQEKGGIPRPSRASEINTLLSRSKNLADRRMKPDAGNTDSHSCTDGKDGGKQ